jgi:hypothetical protein
MPLQQAVVESYDFDRMVVQFTMLDGETSFSAITTAAMDDLEGSRNVGWRAILILTERSDFIVSTANNIAADACAFASAVHAEKRW